METSGRDTGGAPHTGTTIVAVQYDGGVVLGADSRVSTGRYVSNRASDKLTPLHDHVWLLRSGSAADTQLVADYAYAILDLFKVRHYAAQHAIELDREPSVHTLAKLVAQINYANKAMLVGALIVAGWDAARGGQVYGVPIGGTLVRQRWTTDGSGSTYLWGYLDAEYKRAPRRAQP